MTGIKRKARHNAVREFLENIKLLLSTRRQVAAVNEVPSTEKAVSVQIEI
jgi:hypothetical protein